MTKATLRKRQYVPSGQVMRRYGLASRSTLHRWLNDQAFGMPKPERLRNRLYWREDQLDDWDQARAGRGPDDRPARQQLIEASRANDPDGAA